MDPKKNNNGKSSIRLPSRSIQSCCQCNTSLGYRLSDDDDYSGIRKCLPPCRSAYFSDEQSISTMNTWLTILSVLCALSCTFVLLTFFLDMTRFKYPQRPIIFLSLCYFFVSCGYLIRLLLGHENVACRIDNKVNKISPIDKNNLLLSI
jgi:frizzled protein 5/8